MGTESSPSLPLTATYKISLKCSFYQKSHYIITYLFHTAFLTVQHPTRFQDLQLHFPDSITCSYLWFTTHILVSNPDDLCRLPGSVCDCSIVLLSLLLVTNQKDFSIFYFHPPGNRNLSFDVRAGLLSHEH